jgi:hypothetical protein
MTIKAEQTEKTVGDPLAVYNTMIRTWQRNRAVCQGEAAVKDLDSTIDPARFTNLLIPFSPLMTQQQFNFYKAEAELPGITAEFSKMLIGGLLRKKPQVKLPKNLPKEALEWINNNFGEDGSSLAAFLDSVLWEEIQTSRAWIQVDHPSVPDDTTLTAEELANNFKPYPIIIKAESVINWQVKKDEKTGVQKLTQLCVRVYEESFVKNEFHATLVDTIYVHELVDGLYQIRKFVSDAPSNTAAASEGRIKKNQVNAVPTFKLEKTITMIKMAGKRLEFIPIWPLNGHIDITPPLLNSIIDKEIALYNKISRRNHLLYGAATYTPYISSDMLQTDFETIAARGLGTWFQIGKDDKVGVLETPTEALSDMETAIQNNILEIAKLGIRMLTPETAQSGVALELRNASQTAKLSTLNMKISTQMSAIITFMLNWRYNLQLKISDVKFTLSDDFTPAALGEDWLRLITEWYESKLISRNTWIEALKRNDIIPPDYDDELEKKAITEDEIVTGNLNEKSENFTEILKKIKESENDDED